MRRRWIDAGEEDGGDYAIKREGVMTSEDWFKSSGEQLVCRQCNKNKHAPMMRKGGERNLDQIGEAEKK